MRRPQTVPRFSNVGRETIAGTIQENRFTRTRLTTAWAYLRHELLYLCYALLEVSLLTPLALSLMGWARYWPPGQVLLWLLLLMLVPFNLVRLMSFLGLNHTGQLRIMVAALLLTIFFSWRTLLYDPTNLLDFGWLRQFFGNLAETGSLVWTRDLSIFLLILLTWWRGLKLATREHEIGRMGLRLRVGGLIFAPLIIWFAGNFLSWSAVPYLMLFFLATLTAVALVRVEQMEQEQSGHLATLNALWLATIIVAALAIVLTAVVVASIISGESLFFVLELASPVLAAAQFGGAVTAITMVYLGQPFLNLLEILIQALATVLFYLFSLAGEGLRQLSSVMGGLGLPTLAAPTPTATVEASGSNVGGKVGVLVLMIVAIVLVTFTLVRLYQQATFVARESGRSGIDNDEEEKEGEEAQAQHPLRRLGCAPWKPLPRP